MIVAFRAVLGSAVVTAALALPGSLLTSPSVAAPKPVAIVSPCCAGMTLVQDRAPKNDAPGIDDGADDDQTPEDGQQPSDQPPPSKDDNGADPDPDQAQPPDTAEPPGCIFRKGPLDLLV